MKSDKLKQIRRGRRKTGIRKRVIGTPDRPRLTVYRSLKHIYAQIVDDLAGQTLVCASTAQLNLSEGGGNQKAAIEVGKDLAQKAKSAGIAAISFDRNGYRYLGRVKALADAAREGGLQF